MNKLKNNFPDETPLDDYERELKEFLDKGEFEFMPEKKFQKHKKMMQEAAKRFLARKSITLRVKNEDLIEIKSKAEKASIPYQTLLNLLIGQYAKGKIKLAI